MAKKFIHTLQERQKWVKEIRNFQVGGMFLLKVDFARNHWLICKAINRNPDNKGNVCSVILRLGNSDDSNKEQVQTRPITKIILVLEAEPIDSSMKKP